MEEAGSYLAYLSRNHYFVDRHGVEYAYHPLFRQFLLEQGKKKYDGETISSMKVAAARLLASSGRSGESVSLLLDAGAFGEALSLMLAHAPELLEQGRTATLEEWAERLPEGVRENTPWLLYWRAVSRLVTDTRAASRLLEKAFVLLEAQGDRTGSLLCAAAIINSIMLEWKDCRSLDTWIDWIDRSGDIDSSRLSPALEAQVASAMVLGLTWRMPWHPGMAGWIDRAVDASKRVTDISIRCNVKANVIENYGILGHWREMRLVAEELRQLTSSPLASPLVHLAYLFRVIETHDFLYASWDDALSRLSSAIRLAEEIGAHSHFGVIYLHGVWIAFEMENLQLAADFLQKMERTPFVAAGIGPAFYHELNALYHLQMNDLNTAGREAAEAVKAAIESGAPIAEAYCRTTFSYVLRRMRKRTDARTQMEHAEKIVSSLGSTHVLYLIRLNQTSLCLDEDDGIHAAHALKEAFRIGREKEYGITLFKFWQPDEMARLCRAALAAGIEVDYARDLIGRHHLVPAHGRPEELVEWPWPMAVRTFGGFQLTVGGLPPPKAGKKPIDLLKALICLGAEEVRQDAIEDALWPEAEGDMARISLKTTLSRLRKVIGEKSIEVREGKVAMNRKLVWLDVWALESLAERVSDLSRVRSGSPDDIERLGHLVFDIYRGDFLASDDGPWTARARGRLKETFAKTIERLGRMLSEAGRLDRATALYERAVDRGVPRVSFHSF